MLGYKVKQSNEDYNILEVDVGKDLLHIKVKKFHLGNANQIADFYNKSNLIEDGIIIVYNVPTFGDMEPLIMPYKQSNCLSILGKLFSYYCKIKDVDNAERIYNFIYGKAYICDKVLNNNIIVKHIFTYKDMMQINNECKQISSKLSESKEL